MDDKEKGEVVLEHYRKLAVHYIFDEDPEQEELEAEKKLVQEESAKAYKANEEKLKM